MFTFSLIHLQCPAQCLVQRERIRKYMLVTRTNRYVSLFNEETSETVFSAFWFLPCVTFPHCSLLGVKERVVDRRVWAMEVEKHRKQQGNALAWGAGPRQGEVHVGTEGGSL